jgi:hypothetical protein
MNRTADRASLLAALAEIHGEGSVMMAAFASATDEALTKAVENGRIAQAAGRRGERLADVWSTDSAFAPVGRG